MILLAKKGFYHLITVLFGTKRVFSAKISPPKSFYHPIPVFLATKRQLISKIRVFITPKNENIVSVSFFGVIFWKNSGDKSFFGCQKSSHLKKTILNHFYRNFLWT